MARLQILELPEGVDDERAPFVLVVDQVDLQSHPLGPGEGRQYWDVVAERVGARGAIVTPETVEIPVNELPVGPDGYPVRLRVEPDLDEFRAQVAEAILKAQTDARQAFAERFEPVQVGTEGR